MWILYLSLVVFCEVLADIFAKEWSLHGAAIRWVGSVGAYIAASAFWLFALKNGSGLSRGVMMFSVASVILVAVIGIAFYKEHVTKFQLAGMALGIISIALILGNE